MKFFQTKKLIVALLLSIPFCLLSKQAVNLIDTQEKVDVKNITLNPIEEPRIDPVASIKVPTASPQTFKTSGKIVKEVFASKYMTYLNNANQYDAAFRYRTTADGILFAAYGENKKNPLVDAKIAIRFRYDGGVDALVRTAPSAITIGGAPVAIPSSSVQKSILWLRELFVKVSLDTNPSESLHFVKFGSFPYELGRGIALGSAYNSGGFLGLDPRFSIDQFAPGALLHTDIIKDSLSGDLYYAVLSNPNSSFKDNTEVIHANQIFDLPNNNFRGLNRQVWITAGALHWKAIAAKDLKLNVDPYAYMFISPDQKLEFPADSDSQLYAIGTALELKSGRFEWGFDTAFQGGNTNVKAWDRNYTTLVNNDSAVSVQYTKVYTADPTIVPTPALALATTVNQATVKASDREFSQNGQEIGTSGLWNAVDRFRPAQKIFYHGYFFVTDMSIELISKQLKFCADTGISSGHLDDFNDINTLTTAQMQHQNFDGFIPVQSVYSGKRIQHLVMLNTGVPRFTVQDPSVPLAQQHVPSRIMGVATLTDKFTNIAYTGVGLECTPTKFADQKAMIKPVALYYWMVEAPTLPNGLPASHALGTALSVEFMATIKECLDMGGYVGWMVPGKQYQQFAGTKLKGGTLGSDVAYILNFTMTYKF